MKDIVAKWIEEWLRRELVNLRGKLISVNEILELSDHLADLQTEWRFEMLTDIWISFSSEEADVRIRVRKEEFPVSVCLVPIPWRFENSRT